MTKASFVLPQRDPDTIDSVASGYLGMFAGDDGKWYAKSGSSAPSKIGATDVQEVQGIIDESVPIINLDDWGVHPGNSAATNQTAIANLIAKIKNSSEINRFHLRLNRAGTYNIQKGTTGDFLTRYAAILLPSNCIFEVNKDAIFRMPLEQLAYILRNDDPINGNKNITVIGGQWDGNATTNDGILEESVVPGQGYYGNIMWWENVQNLRVDGCVYRNPNLWAMCGTKLNNATFQSIYMDDVHRDGIHLCGECYDCNIFDYEGETHDNSLAISTCQNPAQNTGIYFFGNFNWADGTFVHGDMKRIRIERPHFINSNGPIAIFGREQDTIEDIYICDVTGTTAPESAYAIALTQYPDAGVNPTIRNVVIERVRVTTKTTEVAVFSSGDNTKELTIRDVIANGAGVIITGNNYDAVKIDNIRATGVEHAIQFGNDATGAAFYARNVDIGNVVYNPSGGARSAINIQANASFDNFYVDNIACSASGVGYRGISVAGSTRRSISVGSASFGLGGFQNFAGAADFDVQVLRTKQQDYYAADGAVVRVTKWPEHLHTAGSGIVTSDAAIYSDYQVKVVDVVFSQLTGGSSAFILNTGSGLPLLPRGAVIVAAAIQPQVAFAGPAATTLRVRTSAGTPITPETTVSTVGTGAIVWTEVAPISSATNVAVDWQVLAVAYTGDLSSLTAGRAKVFLKYFVALA